MIQSHTQETLSTYMYLTPTSVTYVSGDEAWPPACCLKYVSGDQFCHRDRVMVDALQPGAVTDVSVEMRSPEKMGFYQGQWRMCTPTGMFFGGNIGT